MKGNSAETCYSGSHNVHRREAQYRLSIENIMTEATESRSQWPVACWDCGFVYRCGHCCLSVASVVFCQVEVSTTGR